MITWPFGSHLYSQSAMLPYARVFTEPGSPEEAATQVANWVSAPADWVPDLTARHGKIFRELLAKYDRRGELVPDAHLAVLAIEHGLNIATTDGDFARFGEVRWVNPLATTA